MIRTGHKCVEDARRELVKHGFTIVHTAPGTPLKWVHPSEFKRRNRRELAVAIERRARSMAFTIVDYPVTPPSGTPATLELALES
jgi:hypothetical protein